MRIIIQIRYSRRICEISPNDRCKIDGLINHSRDAQCLEPLSLSERLPRHRSRLSSTEEVVNERKERGISPGIHDRSFYFLTLLFRLSRYNYLRSGTII